MTLARRLHEMIYKLPRGYVQTALLFSIRPDWPDDSNSSYIAAMSREDLEQAFVLLSRALAECGNEP